MHTKVLLRFHVWLSADITVTAASWTSSVWPEMLGSESANGTKPHLCRGSESKSWLTHSQLQLQWQMMSLVLIQLGASGKGEGKVRRKQNVFTVSDDTPPLPSSKVIFNHGYATTPCSTIPYSLNNGKQTLKLPWNTKEMSPLLMQVLTAQDAARKMGRENCSKYIWEEIVIVESMDVSIAGAYTSCKIKNSPQFSSQITLSYFVYHQLSPGGLVKWLWLA